MKGAAVTPSLYTDELSKPNPQWINPLAFSGQMENHWIDELGNVSSQPLREVWMQIADSFRANIVNHSDLNKRSLWHVLSPPTGSGKTESTMLYCAMLSKLQDHEHPGVLIVVRLTDEADILAKRINSFGERVTATAFHSKNDQKKEELSAYPVLIITHKAYELALDKLSREGKEVSIQATWPFFHDYRPSEGTRKLVVIDECLDIVEHLQVGLESLKQILGDCREELIAKHPHVISWLEQCRDFLKDVYHSTELPACAVLSKGSSLLLDLGSFIKDYEEQPVHTSADKQKTLIRQQRRNRAQALRALQSITASWTYYSKSGKDSTLNSSRLLLPDGVKGAVVMDATAMTNSAYYNLFEDSKLIIPPKNVRNYSNFTLYISKGHKVGKNYMEEESKKIVPDFMAYIQPLIGNQETFFVTHKGIEHEIAKYAEDSAKLSHWGGDVTGSNDYRGCDCVVMYGLPYLPDTWASNTFQAFKGVQTTDWFQNEEGRKARKALENGHLGTSVVQGMNRICIRRTIDSQGNCEAAIGYLLLPAGDTADYILEAIRETMPGINIQEGEYASQKRKPKGSNKEKALLVYLGNMPKGARLTKAQAEKCTGIRRTTMTKLIAKLREPSSCFSKAIETLGVSYVVKQEGKVSRAYFQKN